MPSQSDADADAFMSSLLTSVDADSHTSSATLPPPSQQAYRPKSTTRFGVNPSNGSASSQAGQPSTSASTPQLTLQQVAQAAFGKKTFSSGSSRSAAFKHGSVAPTSTAASGPSSSSSSSPFKKRGFTPSASTPAPTTARNAPPPPAPAAAIDVDMLGADGDDDWLADLDDADLSGAGLLKVKKEEEKTEIRPSVPLPSISGNAGAPHSSAKRASRTQSKVWAERARHAEVRTRVRWVGPQLAACMPRVCANIRAECVPY